MTNLSINKTLCPLILFIGISFTLLNPYRILAHTNGQVPFLKINNQSAKTYPVSHDLSTTNLPIPQDLAPEKYLLNQPIDFQVNLSILPISPEVIAQAKLEWDFGDGTKTTGLNIQHKYTQTRSYIITIYITLLEGSEPFLLDSVLLHVVPTLDYQLPEAKIKVDKYLVDKSTEPLQIKFNHPFKLDASSSTSASKIKDYIWTFNTNESTTGQQTTFNYDENLISASPVLRIITEDGHIADATVRINNQESNNLEWFKNKRSLSILVFKVCIGLASILFALYILIRVRKLTKRKN